MSPAEGEVRTTDKASPDAGSANVRRAGRNFIIAFYAALRAIKLYPLEHSAVQKTLTELCDTTEELRTMEGELELRISGEFIFVNQTRLRLDLSNYASFGHLLTLCRAAGIGGITIGGTTSPRDWTVFISRLDSQVKESPDSRLARIESGLQESGITVFELDPPMESESDRQFAEEAKAAANQDVRAVRRSDQGRHQLGADRQDAEHPKDQARGAGNRRSGSERGDFAHRSDRDPRLRRIHVHAFRERVHLLDRARPPSRDDEAPALRARTRGADARHREIAFQSIFFQKTGELTEEEWKWMASHPWLGVLVLFQFRRQQEELSYRAMTVAYEHHMKQDLTGYPKPIRARNLSMTSKIVAVADGYDAATSRRSYQTVPYPPPAVLQEMRDNPKRGMDPVVVKAFINLLGIYPVGTLVVLDTFELAVVSAANPNPEALSRPIVKIISDPSGLVMQPPITVDLAMPDAGGEYPRTIIKTAEADRYGLNINDYLVQ